MLDADSCYRALVTRDTRFDGRFFTAVTTTGIFCRPVCPARPPKREHCLFMPSAAAAQAAGFRPCLRCRPEAAPGIALWRGTGNTVARALRLIDEGALDGASVEALGDRLGVGGRHLRRLFNEHLGASPVMVAQTRRLLFAKSLIIETNLSMTDVALAAGFGSLRRFNAAMRQTWDRAPGALRRGIQGGGSAGVTLKLPFQAPLDWALMLDWLKLRTIPGVEFVEGAAYRRSIAWDGRHGVVEISAVPGEAALAAKIRFPAMAALGQIAARLKRQFDLDADSAAIDAQLAGDPALAPLIAARPGLRVPGAWDPFELAIRAILGQQVSVGAATQLAGRLVAEYGTPLVLDDGPMPPGLTHVFPDAEHLLAVDPGRLRIPGARARTIAGLAAAYQTEPDLLQAVLPLEQTIRRLCALPGIGPWTAQYIAMRALREPDAFPSGDLALRQALAIDGVVPSIAALEATSQAWRPWRAYAAMHLWHKRGMGGGG